MSHLSLADLFLVGLVLDVSGALLLARGLLLSPRELSRLNTFWGVGYGQHEDRIRNRVAGEFGVTYLVAGFLLQAAGYSFAIAGTPTRTGGDRFLYAWGLALLVGGLAWATWVTMRGRKEASLIGAIEGQREAAVEDIEASEDDQEAPRRDAVTGGSA
jgi:hypothetical protein